jgi:hypothetical protein
VPFLFEVNMADIKEYFIRVDTNIIDNTDNENVTQQPTSQETSAKKVAQESRGKNLGAIAAIQIGKQALNFGLSNYGNLTGDYVTQTQLKAGASLLAAGAMIIANPLVGTIATVGTIGTQAIMAAINVAKTDREAALLRQRTQTFITSGGR